MDGDPEMNQLLGLFDLPAFARRGQELEYAISRMHERCRRERNERLDMVRVRLRQWASAAAGRESWQDSFTAPIDQLWSLTEAEAPVWAEQPAPPRRRRAVARDLVASVVRFNLRWEHFLANLKLDHINLAIENYNRYYTLEKECVLGSARLAARHFVPRDRVSPESLLSSYPTLPVPGLAD